MAHRTEPHSSDPVHGTLSRVVRVQMLEISQGGCLLETAAYLSPAFIGRLEVTIDGRTFVDEMRVVWCRLLPGAGSTYRVGAEFLTLWKGLERPRPPSLRTAVAVLQHLGRR